MLGICVVSNLVTYIVYILGIDIISMLDTYLVSKHGTYVVSILGTHVVSVLGTYVVSIRKAIGKQNKWMIIKTGFYSPRRSEIMTKKFKTHLRSHSNFVHHLSNDIDLKKVFELQDFCSFSFFTNFRIQNEYPQIYGLFNLQLFPVSECCLLEKASIPVTLTKRLFRFSNSG